MKQRTKNKKSFIFSLCVFFFCFCLRARRLWKCEAKSNKEGKSRGRREKDENCVSERGKQLLCAEKQTSLLSAFIICVTIGWWIHCQGQSWLLHPDGVKSSSRVTSLAYRAQLTVKRDLLFAEIRNWNTKNSTLNEYFSPRLFRQKTESWRRMGNRTYMMMLSFLRTRSHHGGVGKVLSDKLHFIIQCFLSLLISFNYH